MIPDYWKRYLEEILAIGLIKIAGNNSVWRGLDYYE